MSSKPFHAMAAAATAASAVFMLFMAYESGLMPGGMFSDAALLGMPVWVVVAVLSTSLVWLSCAHLQWLIRGSPQTPAAPFDLTRAS